MVLLLVQQIFTFILGVGISGLLFAAAWLAIACIQCVPWNLDVIDYKPGKHWRSTQYQ